MWPRPLPWAELSAWDREVYETGFLMGFLMREDEVAQAESDADRFYRLAFDRRSPRLRR